MTIRPSVGLTDYLKKKQKQNRYERGKNISTDIFKSYQLFFTVPRARTLILKNGMTLQTVFLTTSIAQ